MLLFSRVVLTWTVLKCLSLPWFSLWFCSFFCMLRSKLNTASPTALREEFGDFSVPTFVPAALLLYWGCHPLSCWWAAAPWALLPSGSSFKGAGSASPHRERVKLGVVERPFLDHKEKMGQMWHMQPPASVAVWSPFFNLPQTTDMTHVRKRW